MAGCERRGPVSDAVLDRWDAEQEEKREAVRRAQRVRDEEGPPVSEVRVSRSATRDPVKKKRRRYVVGADGDADGMGDAGERTYDAKKIKMARQTMRLSREELAREAGVRLSVLEGIEGGVILTYVPATARVLAKALWVNVEDITAGCWDLSTNSMRGRSYGKGSNTKRK